MTRKAVISVTLAFLTLGVMTRRATAAGAEPAPYYLFYLHGRIVEDKGPEAVSPEHGLYDYRANCRALEARGFVVRSEVRPFGTTAEYGEKIASEVRELLGKGVPASHITIAGHSKGGMLTWVAAASLGNPDLRFAIMAGCGKDGDDDLTARAPKIKGHVLSIVDESDTVCGPCKSFFARNADVDLTEIVTKTGLGHGLFYRPRPEWLDPLEAFAKAGERSSAAAR
ncbi:MAG: hypothetical protein U0166_13615 [Acidobacteriota bacterium]